LDVLATNANDSFMVRLGNMERDFRWQFLLQHRQTMQGTRIGPGDVDQEVVVVERFKLDLHRR
jgi:hypothetical protein